MAERKSSAGASGQAGARRAATTTSTGARSAGPKNGKRAKRRSVGPVLKTIALWGTIAALALALVGVVAGAVFSRDAVLPDPKGDFSTQTTFLYYRDGTKLGELAVQNRQAISYEEMPQSIKDAALAAEDRSFWTNRGISITGMTRATIRILRGGDLQSGSTITQQYIKIRYLTSEQTMARKLRELTLAVKMNNDMTKEQILEGYLNTIYFGRGTYGIQAAAQAFYGVDAKALTVPQSAALAAILNSPGNFDPSDADNVAPLRARYNYVLDGMLEMGTLSQADHTRYRGTLPTFPPRQSSQRYGGPKGFLMKLAENELRANGFSQAQIAGGGLQITTTFDPKMQDAAVASAQKYTQLAASSAGPVQDPAQLHVAIASVAVGTGEVLSLYGGPDYATSQRNWATTTTMTGSTFKPFALVAGLRNGFSLKSILRGDPWTPTGDTVQVRNAGDTRYGPVTLQKATEASINTAYVDLVSRTPDGPNQVMKAATDAGAPKDDGWDANNRIGLGTAEVSPLNMAAAYATFGNNGRTTTTHVIREVKDPTGKVLYSAPTQSRQAIEESVARDVTYALKTVVDEGTGRAVRSLDRDTAGKTGTAAVGSEVKSAWFVAYTKQVSTAVAFTAGDSGVGDLDPYRRPRTNAFYGSAYPAETWNDYMQVAVQGMPKVAFDPPANVNGDGKEKVKLPRSLSPAPPAPTQATSAPAPTTAAPTSEPPPATTQAPPPATKSAGPPPANTATQPPPNTKDPATQTRAPGPPTARATTAA